MFGRFRMVCELNPAQEANKACTKSFSKSQKSVQIISVDGVKQL